jgi:hypothetical protein
LQEIYHQIKKCLPFRCRHAVVIMQTLNWTNQCPLFMTVHHIFEISQDDHSSLVTHARDNWWTLDFANAFVSPGVNSRGELVPSHGASRRQLGDNLKVPRLSGCMDRPWSVSDKDMIKMTTTTWNISIQCVIWLLISNLVPGVFFLGLPPPAQVFMNSERAGKIGEETRGWLLIFTLPGMG